MVIVTLSGLLKQLNRRSSPQKTRRCLILLCSDTVSLQALIRQLQNLLYGALIQQNAAVIKGSFSGHVLYLILSQITEHPLRSLHR